MWWKYIQLNAFNEKTKKNAATENSMDEMQKQFVTKTRHMDVNIVYDSIYETQEKS